VSLREIIDGGRPKCLFGAKEFFDIRNPSLPKKILTTSCVTLHSRNVRGKYHQNEWSDSFRLQRARVI
jgi:hypothetical protein